MENALIIPEVARRRWDPDAGAWRWRQATRQEHFARFKEFRPLAPRGAILFTALKEAPRTKAPLPRPLPQAQLDFQVLRRQGRDRKRLGEHRGRQQRFRQRQFDQPR